MANIEFADIELIDTHCHIQSAGADLAAGVDSGEASTRKLWAKDMDKSTLGMLNKAQSEGVQKLICVGCDFEDSRLAADCAGQYDDIFASIGIHPHEAHRYNGDELALSDFSSLISHPKVVAVGECGLDYFYEHSPKTDQEAILRFQIELAQEHKRPLIFHVREAFDDFWPIFDTYSGIRGVLHSFTDNQANLDKAVERGLYVGVNGIATFTKNERQREMYKNIPMSRLLLETDSPYLTPSPYRGNICEPYHTRVTAEFLSELRSIPLAELAEATTVNARRLFTI